MSIGALFPLIIREPTSGPDWGWGWGLVAVKWLQGPGIPKRKESAQPHVPRNANDEVLRGLPQLWGLVSQSGDTPQLLLVYLHDTDTVRS